MRSNSVRVVDVNATINLKILECSEGLHELMHNASYCQKTLFESLPISRKTLGN